MFPQSEVEVSGTVSSRDVGRMSSLLLWFVHCASTVLRECSTARITAVNLGGISGEQVGLEPSGGGCCPHLTTKTCVVSAEDMQVFTEY